MLIHKQIISIVVRCFSVGCVVLYVAGAGFADDAKDAKKVSAQSSSRAALKLVLRNAKVILTSSGISSLPSLTDVISKKVKTVTGSSSRVRPNDVSGTPPTLVKISELSTIKNLFWAPGVIDGINSGSPTNAQCDQYFSGSRDGASGGQGACHMAESVGYSFQSIVEGETSLCYMQGFPTQKNVASGAIELVSGHFPNGKVAKIFSTPSGAPRLVKINISGGPNDQGGGQGQGGGGQQGGGQDQNQTVFIKISSSADNNANNDLYRAALWFCPEGSSSAKGYNIIEVTKGGVFNSVQADNDVDAGFQHIATVSGRLTTKNNKLKFDTTQTRTAMVEASSTGQQGSGSFKSFVSIAGSQMTVKGYDTFGGFKNKLYTVSGFSGTSALNLKFLQGAFNGLNDHGDNFYGATEWRDLFYAAAPSNTLINKTKDVDLTTDTFYSSPASPNIDVTPYSCTDTPDIEVNLDMSVPSLRESVADCDSSRFNNMHFCHDDPDVQLAEQNFFQYCTFGPPPP